MKLPKYQHKVWKLLWKDFNRTIILCFISYYLAIITWALKGLTGHISIWNVYLCGLYTAMVLHQYVMDDCFNREKWRRELHEMADRTINEVIALREAENIKDRGF